MSSIHELERLVFNETWQKNQLDKDRLYVNEFCRISHVSLVSYEVYLEEFPNNIGLVYFFSDNLGGYTMEGIINSFDVN